MTGEPTILPLRSLRLFFAAAALALINFIVLVDLTVANVAVPHIAGGLAISPTQGTWAITSYAVADAITVPLTGWLAGRLGQVRCLTFSLLGFGFFSFLCGMANSIEMLVLFRIFQGFCGGPLMPLTQTLMMRIFPKDKMGTAMGLWSFGTITAPIFGPILGGTLSDTAGWPWIFFINLPVVAICLFLILRLLPSVREPQTLNRIDYVGLALLVLWVGAFQLMLDIGREHDWFGSIEVVALAVIAAVGCAAFVIWELYEEHPIVDIRLLADRALSISIVVTLVALLGYFSVVVIAPLWMQQTLGYTATNAGHVAAYSGLAAVLVTPLAGWLFSRVDCRLLISLGFVWVGGVTLMRTGWNAEADYWTFALPQFMQGLGVPLFAIGLATLPMSNMAAKDVASASGIMSFVRSITVAIAAAFSTTIWERDTRQAREGIVATLQDASGWIAAVQQKGAPVSQASALMERGIEVQAATVAAINVFAVCSVLFFIAAALVWISPKSAPQRQIEIGH